LKKVLVVGVIAVLTGCPVSFYATLDKGGPPVGTGGGQPPITWSILAPALGGKPGPFSSLVMDSAGTPQVAYYDSTGQGKLKFTSNIAASLPTIVTPDATLNVGEYVSLALDSSKNPYISYHDAGNQQLRFDSASSGVWGAPQVPDTGGGTNNVGQYSSIAFSPTAGFVRISYYDATANALMFIMQTAAATWSSPQVLDSAAGHYVGQYCSLALDASGWAHISYYDTSSAASVLKYIVQLTTTTWSAPQIVDNTANVGLYSSLKLDSSGNARISYYDATNGNLKYAQQTGPSTWNIVVADNSGDVGQYSSLALDSSGNPRIAYYDVTNSSLKCAFGADPGGSSWNVMTVDTGGVGSYASISLEPSTQKVRIAYYNGAGTGSLKYATQQ
jgi:hypothetical protein